MYRTFKFSNFHSLLGGIPTGVAQSFQITKTTFQTNIPIVENFAIAKLIHYTRQNKPNVGLFL
jgi:hypothetical protein